MTVAWILKEKGRNVISAHADASVEEIITLLAKNRIGTVVIVDETHRVLGIISERDIVRTLAEKGAQALERPISEVMTRKVITCAVGETVPEIMERMTVGKFRHVPVVEQGRLIGIISIGDVVKSRVQQMEQESAALQEYIRTA